jgi:hypothetical protein
VNPLQLPADDILKPLHSLGSRPGPNRVNGERAGQVIMSDTERYAVHISRTQRIGIKTNEG